MASLDLRGLSLNGGISDMNGGDALILELRDEPCGQWMAWVLKPNSCLRKGGISGIWMGWVVKRASLLQKTK